MMRYVPDPPEEQELSALARDVLYEYHMAQVAVTRLEGIPAIPPLRTDKKDTLASAAQQDDWNGWLEVLLLHTRTLIEFFRSGHGAQDRSERTELLGARQSSQADVSTQKGNRRRRSDTVWASDFSCDWSGRSGGPELQWLVDHAIPMHKRVAHLTAYRQRVSKEADSVPIHQVHHNLVVVFRRFLYSLTDERRSWFATCGTLQLETAEEP